MYIHKKGYSVIASIVTIVVLFFVLLNFVFQFTIRAIPVGLSVIGIIIIIWSVSFFRVPTNRKITMMDNAVVSSADGEIVAIEEVEEKEYFHDKRIQISVFMSAYDVHVNWFPISGEVSYVKYHPGKKMFAINPKSSELNERNSVAVRDDKGREVMFRQVAGVMARRIVCNVKEGDKAEVGKEFGMIKFGSRVDFFLPLDSEVVVEMGDDITGQVSVLAYLK
ncbi:MAG: phosphatidylserine decarboxylase family protein [Bacteroidales bacterium]|nr:phosphatidylserine decarboxylase family protein [Bacteroidales bacterium]MDD5978649.1 phosphatidylserine decarboxylase family protein [Bacteroidales bacterium]MDD7276217.1 phosphatidylserine decarboxylase family protein [Bacteroidales bacterium]MDY6074373.1 phosphatidylserine decarboxylase family protein [Bacteroidales bacterium]